MTKEYETLKNCLKDFKDTEIKTLRKNYITICEEKVKSHEETDIANFLYLNCIDYEYELPYITSFALSNNAYTPDFRISQGDKIIYVEHYGISEDGKASQMSEETREKYIRHIKDKKEHHRQNNTVLIENYSVYNDGRHYKEHLEEDLKAYGIVFRERDEEELIQKLVKHKSNSYIKELVKLIKNFMSRFIEKGYTDEDFPKLKNTENPRDQLFLDIFEICYNYYENYLKEKCALDFSHMITNAKNILSIDNEQLKTRKYKYIIIDEYQDISKSRMEFVKSLLQYSGAKLMVVGDDWQTIYSFSGSDIKYFTEFDKLFSNPTKFILNKTYRNSQELINIAGNFIMKNNAQLKKQLISDKHCDKPVVVYPYETKKYTEIEYKNRENYAIAVELEKIIERINREQGPDTSILILGRYNKELNDLEDSGLFKTKQKDNTKYLKSDKYPDQKITLSTVHKSKGLGFDNVILINCKDDIYGFPSQVQDDPIYTLLETKKDPYPYAEERRIFYVAITRTKNKTYIVVPKNNPSDFLLELLDNSMVELMEPVIRNKEDRTKEGYLCPKCNFPLYYKPNTTTIFGRSMWICSNNSALCGFVTNQPCKQHLQIKKCTCGEGYLVAKRLSDKAIEKYDLTDTFDDDSNFDERYNSLYILGCTEYPKCHNYESDIFNLNQYLLLDPDCINEIEDS